ncbi:MAG: alpha/beta hydrolase [Lachnospiraceae bacterium]|nr:alpha/beta hydrolase [Lachnospiraceae bacterium]
MKIGSKDINVYRAIDASAPLVIYNSFEGDGKEIYEAVKTITDTDFTLAVISGVEWEREMTPWPSKALYKNSPDFTGEADEYIEFLIKKAVPEIIKEYELKPSSIYLAGYSLGGLLAVYSLYKTDVFHGVASASGSMWYPDFLEYVKENKPKRLPEKIYFSLGNKEAVTKNQTLKKVEENTKALYEHFRDLGAEAFFELNEGNHFKDAVLRMAKGIAYLLNWTET